MARLAGVAGRMFEVRWRNACWLLLAGAGWAAVALAHQNLAIHLMWAVTAMTYWIGINVEP